MKIRRLAAMVDVSRNSVLTNDEIKKFIDVLGKMGYNRLILYMEDLYELPGYEMFGYMRGKYSVKDLKELVAYAKSRGMTLSPYIQTLAHLEHIFRWREFSAVHDNQSILLVDEPKTYEFIEAMIKNMRDIFPDDDELFIGCDEPFNLGRGKFIDKFGYEEKKTVFERHLKRCVEICNKYGFKPYIDGDYFFRIAQPGKYEWYSDDPDVITPEIAAMMPESSVFVYWDYSVKPERMYNMLYNCKKFGSPIHYHSACTSWSGFAPHNHMTMAVLESNIPVALDEGIDDISIGFYGDDGGECSVWSFLPSWFYGAQLSQGIRDMSVVKKNFKAMFGVDFDDFCKLDYVSDYLGDLMNIQSEKMVVFNDPFCGIFDEMFVDGCDERFDGREKLHARMKSHAKELSEIKDRGQFGYLFDAAQALCELIELKFDLGIKTRDVYLSKDRVGLDALIADYDETYRRVCAYYEAFRNVWYNERKGNGFEVQCIRFGGLKERLLDCRCRLEALRDGRIDSIPELDEPVKRVHLNTPAMFPEQNYGNYMYGKITSVNTLTHYSYYGYGVC